MVRPISVTHSNGIASLHHKASTVCVQAKDAMCVIGDDGICVCTGVVDDVAGTRAITTSCLIRSIFRTSLEIYSTSLS
jgi:hypothetical protein